MHGVLTVSRSLASLDLDGLAVRVEQAALVGGLV